MRKSWQVEGTARRLVVCLSRGGKGNGRGAEGKQTELCRLLEGSPGKDLGFYSKCKEKPLGGFEKRSDMMGFFFFFF